MLLRFILIFALASAILAANHHLTCCEPESERLSQSRVKALVKKTEPILAPCCADMLRMSGTVVLAISVNPNVEVICVQTVAGHPLIIGVVIDSVRKWTFQPYPSKGVKKTFCGQIALRFEANEQSVKYEIV